MAFNELLVTPLSRASSYWANSIVGALNSLYDLLVESLEQQITGQDLSEVGYDIIPAEDDTFTLGDPTNQWEAIYGYYGYFASDVYVQGKKVIKDQDPVNIYDIFSPAQQAISNAVQSGLSRLNIDQYGNVGIIISEPVDSVGRVRVSTDAAFQPVFNRASVSAQYNTDGLSVVLQTNGRPIINLFYDVSGAATITIQISADGLVWRTYDVITTSGAESNIVPYTNIAYPYIMVSTQTTGIDVTFEIVASR